VKRNICFQLDGVTYRVEVERHGDQLTVSREGERYTLSLLDEAPAASAVTAGPQAPSRALAAETPRAPETARTATAVKPDAAKPGEAGVGLLRAPMTGLVKEVKVAAGSRVAKGEVVLVMEAMKMDVEVSAPASGVVAEVNVSAGQNVESQAPLLLIRE
jgi:glutaconyl-CoA decarboxylase